MRDCLLRFILQSELRENLFSEKNQKDILNSLNNK